MHNVIRTGTPSKIFVRVSRMVAYPYGSLNRSERDLNAIHLAQRDMGDLLGTYAEAPVVEEEGENFIRRFTYEIVDPIEAVSFRNSEINRFLNSNSLDAIAYGVAKSDTEAKYGALNPETNPSIFEELQSPVVMSDYFDKVKEDEQLVFLKPEIEKFFEERLNTVYAVLQELRIKFNSKLIENQ